MRRLILALLLALPAQAQIIPPDWTTGDTVREALVLTSFFIDWKQTRAFMGAGTHEEGNLILGRNPASGNVNRYNLMISALHVGLAFNLTPRWRRVVQNYTLIVQAYAIANNYRVGVRITF